MQQPILHNTEVNCRRGIFQCQKGICCEEKNSTSAHDKTKHVFLRVVDMEDNCMKGPSKVKMEQYTHSLSGSVCGKIRQILSHDWLTAQSRWIFRACSGFPITRAPLFAVNPYNV